MTDVGDSILWTVDRSRRRGAGVYRPGHLRLAGLVNARHNNASGFCRLAKKNPPKRVNKCPARDLPAGHRSE